MPINPYIDLFGTGAAGAGAGAGGAGTAAAAGIPWSVVLPIVVSLIPSLLGGDEEDEMLDRGRQMQATLRGLGVKPPYQSPYLKQLDPIVFQALINNLGRYANFGFPAGMGMDTGFLQGLKGFTPVGMGEKRRQLG